MRVYGPYQRKDGRKHIIEYDETTGSKRTKSYPRFLMEQKLGRALTSEETVDHIDNNPQNDDISNLQLLTRRDNVLKAIASGSINVQNVSEYSKSDAARERSRLQLTGENNPLAAFSDAAVLELRELYAAGRTTIEQIMIKHNTKRRSVVDMLRGFTYAHVEGPLKKKRAKQIT